ncbi:MAG: hypothetical protein AAGF77_06140 [Bacteroidota bacterium]
MKTFIFFLWGGMIICTITLFINAIFKKRPQMADKVIDYVVFALLAVLIGYAISQTTWGPIEKKLSKELQEYRETQRNSWRRW